MSRGGQAEGTHTSPQRSVPSRGLSSNNGYLPLPVPDYRAQLFPPCLLLESTPLLHELFPRGGGFSKSAPQTPRLLNEVLINGAKRWRNPPNPAEKLLNPLLPFADAIPHEQKLSESLDMALTSALSSMPSFTAKLLKGQQGEGGCSTSWNTTSGLGKQPAPLGAGLRGRLSCSSAPFGARKPNLCPESQQV